MTFEEAVVWLSETFDWDREQAHDFLCDVACAAWDEGARNGSRGLLPARERARRNPYRSLA